MIAHCATARESGSTFLSPWCCWRSASSSSCRFIGRRCLRRGPSTRCSSFPAPLVRRQYRADYRNIEAVFPPFRPILNSLIVARPQDDRRLVLVSALAGYGLSRYTRAPGAQDRSGRDLRDSVLSAIAGADPFFLQMNALGWLNTYWPLIVPALASGFGVIWMYTYIGSTVPKELYEAARWTGPRVLRRSSSWFCRSSVRALRRYRSGR